MQVKRVGVSADGAERVRDVIDGARVATGMDALEWARRGEELGAGEIVVNSIDQDGTQPVTTWRSRARSRTPSGCRDRVGWGRDAGARGARVRSGRLGGIVSSMLYSPRLEGATRSTTSAGPARRLRTAGPPDQPRPPRGPDEAVPGSSAESSTRVHRGASCTCQGADDCNSVSVAGLRTERPCGCCRYYVSAMGILPLSVRVSVPSRTIGFVKGRRRGDAHGVRPGQQEVRDAAPPVGPPRVPRTQPVTGLVQRQ